jgi:DNA polymerase III epsilon subunit-like protein
MQEQTFKVIVFDTETTGLPLRYSHNSHPDLTNTDNYTNARIVQMAWQQVDIIRGVILQEHSFICIPTGEWIMSTGAEDTHGITRKRVEAEGRPLLQCLEDGGFWKALADSRQLVAHNISFDYNVLLADLFREGHVVNKQLILLQSIGRHCTMTQTTQMCQLPFQNGSKSGKFKWPKLIELHSHLFNGEKFTGAHDALEDVRATTRCLIELLRLRAVSRRAQTTIA